MVTFDGNGGSISGVSRKTLHAGDPSADETDAAVFDSTTGVGFFNVDGTVDSNVITRIDATVPFASSHSPYDLSDDLIWSVSVSFSSADFALNPGKWLGMGLFVVPASQFVDGYIPTPAEVVNLSIDQARGPYYTGNGVSSLYAGTVFGYGGTVVSTDLDPATKYWACSVALTFDQFSLAYTGPAVGNTQSANRCISFWTNRPPDAPIITSPASGSVVTAGRDIDFSFIPQDPDGAPPAPNDYRPWAFEDMSGIQVQYAPRPTIANPSPTWEDLPIVTTEKGVTLTEGQGWFIEGTTNSSDPYLGAKQLHHTKTMKIRCGGVNLKRGYGVLPSGDWQLRMRTFDYGHALGTVRTSSTAVPGYGALGIKYSESPSFVGDGSFPSAAIEPDDMPASNTSPWSAPVNISVSTEVPKPVAISPVDHVAIPEGNDVVLNWQYRNTYIPPWPQEAREVQIRKRGETTWNTIVSGTDENHFYNVTDMVPGNDSPVAPPAGPHEYCAFPGFEGTTGLDGWSTTGAQDGTTHPVLQNTTSNPAPRSGSRMARLRYTGNIDLSGFAEYNFMRMFDLDTSHRYMSVKGWARRGDKITRQRLFLWFLNTAEDTILGPLIDNHLPDEEFIGSGDYKYAELIDVPIPVGATRCWVTVVNEFTSGSSTDWPAIDDFSILGSPTLPVEPDPIPALDIPTVAPTAYPLVSRNQYEWRVRVADTLHVDSEWSTPASFWVVPAAGSGPLTPLPGETIDGAALGCGKHRVEIYRRGGEVRVGELTQVSYVDWGRLRDDISDAKIVVSGWDVDCGNLLKDLQTWAYEVVIWRDNGYSNERVWEGPITLLSYENDKVTINAKDVTAYLYRRIIKQAMNDSGSAGGATVVARAARIIQNVLAPDDPNLLAYLQVISNDSDAMEYRNLPPWSRTAYEEIDDMAANAGLDYTAVGRAILLWGTKNRIGTLPELRDSNLGSSPVVSEYGMNMANVYSVSDGNGVHGEAYRLLLPEDEQTSDEIYGPGGEDTTYGLVEKLSSSWASNTEEEAGTYTQEGLETIERSFAEFAERSIADSYPPPVVVRVPDNTTLNPNTVLSIQSLVPGVAIPLRSEGTLRVVKSMQKLDSVNVVETNERETISITLSPFNHEDTSEEIVDA